MLYIAVFFIVIATVLLFVVRINILVEYRKSSKDDNFIISVYTLGGLLKYKFEFPLLDLKKRGIKLKSVQEIGKRESDVKKENVFVRFEQMYHKMKVYSSIFEYLLSRITAKDLRISIKVGIGDPFYTGTLTGLIWAAVGILYSYAYRKINIEKKCIKVESNFNKKDFKVDVYCIFSCKLVHIIIVTIKLLYKYLVNKVRIKRKIGGGISV